MQLSIKTRNLDLTDPQRAYVEKKIGRLTRFLEPIGETLIELRKEHTRQGGDRVVAQVTMVCGRTILRGEEHAPEVQAAVDQVEGVMQRQIQRFKGRRQARRKGGGTAPENLAPAAEPVASPVEAEAEELASGRVVRVKRFALEPMFEEDAIEQLELLGHQWYVFRNAETEQLNVIYRRGDGDYGLIVPEGG